MNLDDLLNEEENKIIFDTDCMIDETDYNLLDEAKHTRSDEYPRYWHHFTPEEKEQYVKEGHKPKSGCWIYKHREAMGLDYHDKDKIVHHRNRNKNDYDKKNLQVVSRSEHAIVDPNARKNFKCKMQGCGNEHYAHGLCRKHYMRLYRNNKFGNYDEAKNRSKKER